MELNQDKERGYNNKYLLVLGIDLVICDKYCLVIRSINRVDGIGLLVIRDKRYLRVLLFFL